MSIYKLLLLFVVSIIFFFKQKTAYEMRISDWSSDVCSSDLAGAFHAFDHRRERTVDHFIDARSALDRQPQLEQLPQPPRDLHLRRHIASRGRAGLRRS